MKKYLLLIIFHLSPITFCDAQNPLVKQWDYRFGGKYDDRFSCFQQTNDGGYILGGRSYSYKSGDKTQSCWDTSSYSTERGDYWIVKTNLNGIKQWDKRFGGTHRDCLNSIQLTTDGGFILGGYSGSGISGDKTQASRGGDDYWIVKIDSLGNKQWDMRYGGTSLDQLNSLQQTFDGGYILGGYSYSDSSGDKTQPAWGGSNHADYWIVKVDSNGNKQWDKRFGGTDSEVLESLVQNADGGYLLGGRTYTDPSDGDITEPSRGFSDYWIVKTDSIGNKQWDKRFGGSFHDQLFSLQMTNDNGYILGGWSESGISGDKTQPNLGSGDYWIVKIDSMGNKLWDKDYGGFGNDALNYLSITNDNGYLISGMSGSNIGGNKTENNLGWNQTWIVKTDSIGNIQFDKTLLTNSLTGFADLNGLAIQTNDGCYAIADYTSAGIGGNKTQPNWDSTNAAADYWFTKFCDSSQIVLVPNANLNCSDTNFCEKQCIDFYDLSTNNASSWQWFFPGADSITSTLQNPTNICYNNSGYYDLTLIACNAAGCDSITLQNFIHVKSVPLVNLGNDTTICIGDSIIIDAGAGYPSYLWNDNTTLHSITVSLSGTYSVKVTSGGCWVKDTIQVLTQQCSAPIIGFASTDSIFCEKQCINFFDLSQNTPTSWQWYFPGASPDTSTQQNPTNICYNLYGNYNVTLVACNAAGCDSVFFPAFINVLPTPPAPVITVSNDTLFASGSYSFAWYEVSNPAVVIGTDSFFVFTPPGSYYVIATDSNGCAVVSNVVNTGVQSLSSEPFTITPNPASDYLTINTNSNKKQLITISDITGKIIYSTTTLSEKTIINTKDFPQGVYLLRMDGVMKRFVKL